MAHGNLSPLTGVIDEKDVYIDFGQYEGLSVKELTEVDPDFYEALIQEKGNGIYAIKRLKDKTFRLYVNPLAHMDQ